MSSQEVWHDLDDDVDSVEVSGPSRRRLPRPLTAILALLAIVAAVAMTRTGQPSSADLPIERSTDPEPAEAVQDVDPAPAGELDPGSFQLLEEARILLALAAAEAIAVRDIGDQADVPPQRLRILADQTAGHLARITRFRMQAANERTSGGELAAAYREHVGHDALVRRLLLIESRARDLALLEAVHYSGVRDIAVTDLAQARDEVQRRLELQLFTPGEAAWAEALLAYLDGQNVDVEAARAAALEEWPRVAAQIGGRPPAGEELAAYVDGLDAEVFDALRREHYFDGVLRFLVSRGEVAAGTVPSEQ